MLNAQTIKKMYTNPAFNNYIPPKPVKVVKIPDSQRPARATIDKTLQIIKATGGIYRADLIKKTGLCKASIDKCVRVLLEEEKIAKHIDASKAGQNRTFFFVAGDYDVDNPLGLRPSEIVILNVIKERGEVHRLDLLSLADTSITTVDKSTKGLMGRGLISFRFVKFGRARKKMFFPTGVNNE